MNYELGIGNWELGIGNWELGIGKILSIHIHQSALYNSLEIRIPGSLSFQNGKAKNLSRKTCKQQFSIKNSFLQLHNS
ncbi:MAG: hypothetical protein SAL70_37795 [Scytonema sp. PMC 1070.18]|nr:hypothetical protein [Scytonema sp. PMC 1070.18]